MNTNMKLFTITETPHRGKKIVWTHFGTEAQLITKLLWNYDDAPLDCTLDEAVEYLRCDYQSVQVTV